MPDTPAGPSGQPPLQEPEPETYTVTMATTTLHPVGPADSHGFCNWGASGRMGGGERWGVDGFGWGGHVCFYFCQI